MKKLVTSLYLGIAFFIAPHAYAAPAALSPSTSAPVAGQAVQPRTASNALAQTVLSVPASPVIADVNAGQQTAPTALTQPAPAVSSSAPPQIAPASSVAAPATSPAVPQAAPAVQGQLASPTAASPAPAATATATVAAPATKAAADAVVVSSTYTGTIINAKDKRPLANVRITLGNQVVYTNPQGAFTITGQGSKLGVFASGYARQQFVLSQQKPPSTIALSRFIVKGLYLTDYGLANSKLRNGVLDVVKRNHMNALVIDVKDDHGLIYFKLNAPLTAQVGAESKILIKDMPGMVADLKSRGLYLIARVAVFKDNVLATTKPEWAAQKNGKPYVDRQKMRWTDPFVPQVQQYNIGIAKAAAAVGFDEIQLDYVRFPDAKGVVFSKPVDSASRTQAITTFLQAMHQALIPYNVTLSADIFGYVLWNENDTGIGQQVGKIADAVDIISPMLYPSGFQWGIPNYLNPIKHPYEIVYFTLKHGQARTDVSSLHFRPWLQAFNDYAFHGGVFTEDRMRQQIQAAEDFGAEGYLFWNPRNVYPTGIFTNTHVKTQSDLESKKAQ